MATAQDLAPNPAKVALFLEESGLAYKIAPVDTRTYNDFRPLATWCSGGDTHCAQAMHCRRYFCMGASAAYVCT